MKEDGLLANAERVGNVLRHGLADAFGGLKGVREVRGMGMMIGVELEDPCTDLVKKALEAGLIINVTVDKVVRLLPPLVMSEVEAREVLARLVPLVKAFVGNRVTA
jgi:acetylornithine aminotransferase